MVRNFFYKSFCKISIAYAPYQYSQCIAFFLGNTYFGVFMKQGADCSQMFGNIHYKTYHTLSRRNYSHIRSNSISTTFIYSDDIITKCNGVFNNPCRQISILRIIQGIFNNTCLCRINMFKGE
ncbi:hypothetical protein D3C86_1827330 [compost metagenome]